MNIYDLSRMLQLSEFGRYVLQCKSFLIIFSASVSLFVWPIVSDKHQNGWTDCAQFQCATSHDPSKGLKYKKGENKIYVYYLEVFVWKCANSKRKISQNLNGRLAEQQLKAKTIYREGGAKRHKNLEYVKRKIKLITIFEQTLFMFTRIY